MKIDVYHDIACPWCRIGKANLETALAEWAGEPVTVHWQPFLLDRDVPNEGVSVPEFYKAKFGAQPDAIGGLAYDAMRLLGDALTRLHATDPAAFEALDAAKADDAEAQKAARAKLRDLINGVQAFPGVTGPITFDADRNPVKPAVVIKIENGVEKFAASIAP